MAPSQSAKVKKASSSTQARSGTMYKKRKHKKKGPQSDSDPKIPGVQKLKASLRQTRRLLARENLAADVRVETERRLAALQADLQQAEVNRKERSMATKYHKIKFFERQKILRKLHQAKRDLSALQGSDAERERTQERLFQLRVDLNYILYYPKTKKYISLFPPEVRGHEPATTGHSEEAEKTAQERISVRRWIEEQMKTGTLPIEPETSVANAAASRNTSRVAHKKDKPSAATGHAAQAPVEDPFFESDGDTSDVGQNESDDEDSSMGSEGLL